ncbi:MAG TPA: DUF3095 family protein [Thermohalobaculum sp.]|nr:DUF3095 family protein [Thermohalobaculum sp.]
MTDPSSSTEFYAALPSFSEFDDFTEFDAYAPVPDDWVVLCGDIRGSTQAIAEGRYKQVNMVGASVITVVLNACAGYQIPFVFGGDGGFAVVPAPARDHAVLALQRLQGFSQDAFGMGLRAAAVPVSRLRAEGFDVRVRKYAMSPGNNLALFAGGGVERADQILKSAPDSDPAILRAIDDPEAPDLEGLSCRWEPLAASRGQMIALMVQPVVPEQAAQVFRQTLAQLSEILQGGIADHAPVSDRTLRFRWPPKGLAQEARATAGRGSILRSYAWALVTAALQFWCERRGRKIGAYDAPRYRGELKAQTDFRKYDGMLRTVLDVTPAQAGQIEDWLERQYRNRRLVYGLHRDRAALMTCLVFSLEQGEHVHFVDAAGGGFAKAAEGFKARLAAI